MSGPLVEVLTFEGCPHAEPALELVRRVLADSGVGASVRRVDVPDADVAERDQYVLSCRIYRTDSGITGEPDEQWLREALSAAG